MSGKKTEEKISPESELKKGCDLNFYRCVFRTDYGCDYYNEKDSPCAYGLSQTINKRHIKMLKSDTRKYGYSVLPIELHILYLNNIDYIMNIEDKTTKSLKLETDKAIIAPFSVKDYTARKPSVKPSMRASEFNKHYDCQRIWSKVDKRRFGLKDNRLSIIGRTAHALMNQQHTPQMIENTILEEMGLKVQPRDNYCETELHYETKVRGHPVAISGHSDALLQMTTVQKLRDKVPGDLMIFDLKRKAYSMFEEKGYKMQLLLYGLAAEQQFNLKNFNIKNFYLVTAKRPRKPAWRSYRSQQYTITNVFNDESSVTKDMLTSEIERTYTGQKRLLEDYIEFRENKKHMARKRICKGCFDRDICGLIKRKAKRAKMPIGDYIEDELKATVGEMIMPG